MLDKSAIILGFTGSIGSGCSYISKEIPAVSSKYHYFKLSEFVRHHLEADGIDKPTVAQMQQKGNDLRKEYGRNALAVGLTDWLEDDKETTYQHVIIDGIKNYGEIKYFRQFPNFYLFSVQADRDQRRDRVVGQGKPFRKNDDFYAADKRDEFEASNDGQQVKKCSQSSDIIIVNEKQFAQSSTRKKFDYVNNIID